MYQRKSGSKKPNIVFIRVDDMGWKDLGIYRSSFYETPNIDGLARQGMRFTDAYAGNPVCPPPRSSIMTGQYPVHTSITDWIIGMQNTTGPRPDEKLLPSHFKFNLDTSQVTIAESLKTGGYTTFWQTAELPQRPNQSIDSVPLIIISGSVK